MHLMHAWIAVSMQKPIAVDSNTCRHAHQTLYLFHERKDYLREGSNYTTTSNKATGSQSQQYQYQLRGSYDPPISP